jgi:cobalt/nickel transport system ATP-binding protein
MLGGKILQEDIPEVAFGNPEYIRRAHLSFPTLLELHMELQKRGFLLQGKKPRTVLDMMHCFETALKKTCCHARPGAITICNVDRDHRELLLLWCSSRPGIPVGAMGTRAKQQAEISQIRLDFTYGVIDKCILKALLGENSLIMTTDSMVQRVNQRVDTYCRESGIRITVNQLITAPESTDEETGSAK